jgi:hypothetical protein
MFHSMPITVVLDSAKYPGCQLVLEQAVACESNGCFYPPTPPTFHAFQLALTSLPATIMTALRMAICR